MLLIATVYSEPSLATYAFLVLAILLALAFEFVNGFHDTANAVATVIYTNTLKATPAVVWSGVWNLIGVLTSSGLVAFGIVALLPVELVLNIGSAAGFAMVFSLLISAILWNVDRLDYRRWSRQLAHGSGPFNHPGGQLGEGPGRRAWPPDFSRRRILRVSASPSALQGIGENPLALPRPQRRDPSTALDPVHSHAHLHRGELRAWLE